ncbi:MAG: hypothetical protein PHX34_02170 [Candidatus Shapirobacteria bacterium]|nr:hypothetical protein [Candidatus Shapirobacteria bacterium]
MPNNKEGIPKQLEQFPTDGLTLKEDQQLTDLLSKWNGGRISTPVFTELAKMIPQSIVELVIFRQNNDVLETLLIPRPKDDIVWPGMLHNPGSAIRNSDFKNNAQQPEKSLFERLQNSEVKAPFASPIFVDLHRGIGQRGSEVAQIYFTEMLSEPNQEGCQWCPVDQLAQNPKFIQDQLEHIKLAAEQYKVFISSDKTFRSNLI